MSLILKGIDLPVNDRYTTLRIYKNGHIWLGKTLVGIAIQIPKGHGRLIDEDALFKDLREQQIPFNSDINSAINVAPTIFESEEE